MRRTPRTALAAASVLLALVVGMTTVAAPPAVAAATPTVSGTVTTSNGEPMVATVTFYPLDGAGLAITTQTASGGSYSVNVPRGRYHVRYSPKDSSTIFATKWRGNSLYRSTSTVLTVGSSGYIGDAAVLTPGSYVLRGAATVGGGRPGGAIRVDAYAFDPVSGVYEGVPARTTYASDLGGASFPYWLPGMPAGTYRIVFSASAPLGSVRTIQATAVLTGPTADPVLNANLGIADIRVTRLAGESRFGTAAAISEATWIPVLSTPRSVFVVNGMNFPDALGAGPAAALEGAPILLVQPTSIPAETAQELSRLMAISGPLPIYVIGGPGSVSDAVLNQLRAYSPSVERVSGPDRFATSRAIVSRFWDDVGAVFLASGGNFPDALAGGPVAYAQGGPLVLVNGTAARLDAETEDLIGDVRTVTALLGGTGVLSAGIEAQLAAMSLPGVRRLAGADRYATGARTVDEYANAFGGTVYLANGANFPDALAGAAMAATLRSPVLLVKQNCIPASVYDELNRLRPNSIVLLGGIGVLGTGVATLSRC